MPYVRASDDESVGMDRISGVRHQHGIATIDGRHREMRQSFLRADGDDGFGIRIELDVVTGAIPVTDRAPQPRYPARHRIAVGIIAAGDFAELINDMAGRRLIRVTHAEIDDVLAALARGHLEIIDLVEDVRRQAIDTGESGAHSSIMAYKRR